METSREPAGSEGITLERQDALAIVSIDRPPVNALTFAAYDRLADVFEALAGDPGVAAVILTGAGDRAFCAGHHVGEFVDLTPAAAESSLTRARRAFDAVQACPVPVIALVNGPAIGAGFALASLSDVRLCSTHAVFALPEIDVGVLGSASHLMRLAPQGLTRLLVLTGRRLSAQAALRHGIVEELHAPDALHEAGMALAREMAAKSLPALRLAKSGLNRLEELDVRSGYELECSLTVAVRAGADAAEGALAFIEKRSPIYGSGRVAG